MAEHSGSEATEEPTARKLRNARDDGQVARSVELPAAAVTIGAILVLYMVGSTLVSRIANLFAQGFRFDRKTLDNPDLLATTFAHQIGESFLLIVPVMLVTAVVAVLASGATGGYLFSIKSVMPKFSKLSPMSGFGRMFGSRAAVELLKSVLKFTLVASVLWLLVTRQIDALMQLGQMGLEPALAAAGAMIGESALWLSLSLLVIALIDAPYQRYSFIKRMRMTKQEIKDEMKDMEGRPEVKAQIRQRQREMANARMIQKVKDADVVITNPEHFAVALSYDPTGDGAPLLLAKGSDHMAARIREEAQKNGVEIFAAAPLARALYYSTKLDHPVPEALYLAVAQVIAYVFSLADVRPGVTPMAKPQPKVPKSMQFDVDGKLVST
ncbi:MAG: flagellar biosynthesis protein FlhB [Betaproteobacteria bacterium]|jgi:flagellar biosynthetic protein FlhB|nr:flagellar biosynthesis protein FlhB [Burkholderiales bacterium]NBX14777.1 flagellar biosynthesis protein FlhB [Betaproteobacteria bacterium]NBX89611.1 flagellar biosynthesis protein FlhB [Betaproteobacteria bacterium]